MTLKTSMQALVAVAGLGLLPALAIAAEDATVKDIDVSTEIEGVEGANALDYYPDLETDLEKAVAQLVEVTDDPNGYDIDVKVQSVSLDGDTVLPDTQEFNQMEGVVVITSPMTDQDPHSYPVRLIAITNESAVPEGFIQINPSPDDFYNAMVQAFASNVAENLPEFMSGATSK